MYMGACARTHTRARAPHTTPLNPLSHLFWNISPTSSILRIRAFVQTCLGAPRPHYLPLKKFEINSRVPSPLWLRQANYPLSTKVPSEKQINKEKNLKPWSSHILEEATKAFICRDQSWRDVLNEQRRTAPWEQRGSREPLGPGTTFLTSLARGKGCFNCPSLFFQSSL